MRELITNDTSTCVGCNRCIRYCPVEGANIAYNEGNDIKVKVEQNHCIACGACIQACQHGSRDYFDDTERFLSDLQRGVNISIFAAPANRANGENWNRLLTWLRQKGVKKIYDVSLGADICTWAHIRYIQKEKPATLVTQPCPAIVNYILMHNHDLLPYLSPVHSPMLCTAIYMKKYEHINDKIAALSPCIAKTHEFEATGYVEYNVTLKKLYEYIERNKIKLPDQETDFDHPASLLGCLYSMPGGLKENVEQYLGKALRIDKSEGQGVVYKALEEFSRQGGKHLPAIFDVLNCQEGCNLGTGCEHERNIFQVNAVMDDARQDVLRDRDKADFDAQYEEFDRTLRLSDFIRVYKPLNIRKRSVTDAQIEEAFLKLEKETDAERKFDCAACGSDTCLDMARKIVLGVNIPENCVEKSHKNTQIEHRAILDLSATNLSNIKEILKDITQVKEYSDEIKGSVSGVNTAIEKYRNMAKEIDAIAMRIQIISLNASVEAARSGEHGKTFAVVAEEIRNLARSSKNTVSETEQITEHATGSISGINRMVSEISVAVEKAFADISEISKQTQITLEKSGFDVS